MNKEEIKKWLQNNQEKTDVEIKAYLLSEMNKDEFGESWTRGYFLDSLKNPKNGLSNNVLEVISKIQKEDNGEDNKETLSEKIKYTLVGLIIVVALIGISYLIGISGEISGSVIFIFIVSYFFMKRKSGKK
jgi:hypothetical protein